MSAHPCIGAPVLPCNGRRWRDHPLRHVHPHRGNVWRERSTYVPEDREEGGLAPPLKTHNHQLHAVVRDAVPVLGPQVGQEVFGGTAPGHAREEMGGDVGDGQGVEDELPAVAQLTQLQWQHLDVRIASKERNELLLLLLKYSIKKEKITFYLCKLGVGCFSYSRFTKLSYKSLVVRQLTIAHLIARITPFCNDFNNF